MARTPRDLVVRFLADVSGFVRGSEDVQRELDATSQALDDVAREGDEATRDLSRSFDKAGQEIDRETDDIGRKAKSALGAAGSEAGSLLSGGIVESLMEGDIVGAAKGVADEAASFLGGGGPIAIALGAVAALGGLIFKQMQEQAAKVKEATADAFDELINGADKATRLRNRLEVLFGDMTTGLDEMQRLSEATGVSVEDIGTALAEGGAPAQRLLDRLKAMEASGTRYEKVGQKGERKKVMTDQAKAAQELHKQVSLAADATERGKRQQELWNDALSNGAALAKDFGPGSSTYSQQVPYAARAGTGSRTTGKAGNRP